MAAVQKKAATRTIVACANGVFAKQVVNEEGETGYFYYDRLGERVYTNGEPFVENAEVTAGDAANEAS